MHVVGHEAVRENCEPTLIRRARDLQQHEINDSVRGEQPGAFVRAERQEIGVEPKIIELAQMLRPARSHTDDPAIPDPT